LTVQQVKRLKKIHQEDQAFPKAMIAATHLGLDEGTPIPRCAQSPELDRVVELPFSIVGVPEPLAGGPAFIRSEVLGGLPLRFCFLQGWEAVAFILKNRQG